MITTIANLNGNINKLNTLVQLAFNNNDDHNNCSWEDFFQLPLSCFNFFPCRIIHFLGGNEINKNLDWIYE